MVSQVMIKEYEGPKASVTSGDLSSRLGSNSDFVVLAKPKLSISKIIAKAMSEQDVSMRQFAESIGMKHPQVHRITSGKNYNVDTLLRVLDGLGLEVVIKKKDK